MISKVLTNKIFSSIEEFYIQKGVQPLGIGSFGTVRMGLHKYSNKKYAIKIICIDNNFTQSQCSLLERQIQIHFGLNHPHIIKLWDVIQDKQKIYLIMEYAPNGNMFNFQAKQKKLSQMDSFKIFYQTLQAIDYIHDNDIFHRDIKPQNILIDHQMNVKICDFGWAAPNIHRKRTTFCGTYEYMAPQMINQEITIIKQIYGPLEYYFSNYNNAPFQAQSLQEMKTQVSKGSYQINVSIPKQLKNLIISILQFDPKDRPQLSDVKQHAWVQKMKRHLQQNIILQKSQKKKSIKNAHGSMQALPKKCVSKFSSLLFSQQEYNKGNAICKVTNDIKKFKKKCKTLQQESLQKIVKPIKHLFTLNTEKQNDNGIPYQNIHSPKKYQINKLQFSKTQSQKMFMQNNFIKKTLINVEKNQKPGIIISQRNAVECKKKGKKIF